MPKANEEISDKLQTNEPLSDEKSDSPFQIPEEYQYEALEAIPQEPSHPNFAEALALLERNLENNVVLRRFLNERWARYIGLEGFNWSEYLEEGEEELNLLNAIEQGFATAEPVYVPEVGRFGLRIRIEPSLCLIVLDTFDRENVADVYGQNIERASFIFARPLRHSEFDQTHSGVFFGTANMIGHGSTSYASSNKVFGRGAFTIYGLAGSETD